MIILQTDASTSVTSGLTRSLGPILEIFLQPQVLGLLALFGIILLLNTFNGSLGGSH
jgi:hypothetical protein